MFCGDYIIGFLIFSVPQNSRAASAAELKAKIYSLLAKVGKLQKAQVLGTSEETPFVKNASSVEVIYPNGGEVFLQGQKITVSWSAEGVDKSDWFEIYSIKASDTGQQTKIHSRIHSSKRSYSFKIPNNYIAGDYLIKINLCKKSASTTPCFEKAFDTSDAPFQIANYYKNKFEISVSGYPLSQNVVAGKKQFLFANYNLNAGGLRENAVINSFPLKYTASMPAELSNCALYDGGTALMTGSNIVNIGHLEDQSSIIIIFTLDKPLVVNKKTIKQISLKCDVAGNAVPGNTFSWGYDEKQKLNVSGQASGKKIEVLAKGSDGQKMTVVSSGSYSVYNEFSESYDIVSAGSLGYPLLKLKFTASPEEDIDIKRVNFQLNDVLLNTPLDLVGRKIKLYSEDDLSKEIGEATFAVSDYATSTTIAKFIIPAGGSKIMFAKGDIANISASIGHLTSSGDLLKVAFDGDSNGIANGNYGIGVSSAVNITTNSTDSHTKSIRIMKSYPSLSKISLSENEKILRAGSFNSLYKFKVRATGGDVFIYKFTFGISFSTESAKISNFGLYAYTDSEFSTRDTIFSSDGLLNNQKCGSGGSIISPLILVDVYMNTSGCAESRTVYKIPVGETRYFKFTGTVSNVNINGDTTPESIFVRLEGDSSYEPSSLNPSGLLSAQMIDNTLNNDFIWSPNSTSTQIYVNDADFTNGYGVYGLPQDFMEPEILKSVN